MITDGYIGFLKEAVRRSDVPATFRTVVVEDTIKFGPIICVKYAKAVGEKVEEQLIIIKVLSLSDPWDINELKDTINSRYNEEEAAE